MRKCVKFAVLGNMTVCTFLKGSFSPKIYALLTTSAYKFLLCHHYVVLSLSFVYLTLSLFIFFSRKIYLANL